MSKKDILKPKKRTSDNKRKNNPTRNNPTKKKIKKGTGTAVPFPFNLLNF